MKRCRSCLTKAESQTGCCPICKIDQDKKGRELSPDEKKVRRSARNIRGVAMLHLIGFVLSLYVLLIHNPAAVENGEFIFSPAIIVVLSAINLALAYGLSRYTFWAYKLATVFYFLIGIANIISVQLLAILITMILLYLVGNGTAKAIFERNSLS